MARLGVTVMARKVSQAKNKASGPIGAWDAKVSARENKSELISGIESKF